MPFDEIPLNDLADNDYNPRRRIDENRIAELADSIERVGLISPLTVRRIDGKTDLAERLVDDALDLDQPEDPSYEVVAGTRRLHALREIHGKGSEHEVACQVVDLPDDEAELLALAENLDRDDLTPTEEAEAFADRVFVTVEKATAEALKTRAEAEVRMAGNNYTVSFQAFAAALRANGVPAGTPLRFPHETSSSVQTVADDIASRTPDEIARRCRLYALPQEVWPLVDDDELPLRQAEIIAGLAGVEAPWKKRVEAMIDGARECVDEAWAKVHCREEVEEPVGVRKLRGWACRGSRRGRRRARPG